LVEHSTENAGVASSTLALPTSPSSPSPPPAGAAPRPPGWSRAEWRAAVAASLAAAALAWATASSWRPLPLAHAATWLLTGLVALPALFAAALTGVAAALTALLCLLATPHLLLGRPTGLGEAVAAIWALPRSILPGYLAALRRVRRPRMWGAAAGFVAGVAAYVATHGFRPPPG
jgi:hypothetical protein